jgi:hypothetical protein
MPLRPFLEAATSIAPREFVVEIYAGNLENAIATQKSLGPNSRVIAIDKEMPSQLAIEELERYGGQFIQASGLRAVGEGTADRIVAHYPWKTREELMVSSEMIAKMLAEISTSGDLSLMSRELPMTTDQLPAEAFLRLRVGGLLDIVTENEYVSKDLLALGEKAQIPAPGGGHFYFEVSAECTTAGEAAPNSPGLQVEEGPIPPETPVYHVIMKKKLSP